MSEWIYRMILRLYPSQFREEYGAAALALFRARMRAERGFIPRFRLWLDVIGDAVVSIPAEYRREPLSATGADAGGPFQTGMGDGPIFYQCNPEIPRRGALINGGIATIAFFAGLILFMGSTAKRVPLLIGSHHPAVSHMLPARTDAIPKEELDSEVRLKPMPYEPPISPYFKLILVLGVLDTDHDNIISAEEIENAPARLRMLDKNHDGTLSAEECGQRFGVSVGSMNADVVRNARLMFMRFHPVLAALDSNHDGEISASEIRNAPAALRALDANHDGKLTEDELRPVPVETDGGTPGKVRQ
jgi:Ca2+-binding EF-hand superfamily protein